MSFRKSARTLSMLAFLALLFGCGDKITVYESDGITIIPGSVHIDNQSDLNLIDGVRQVLGSLEIGESTSGQTIHDLSPLRDLIYVGGDLSLVDLTTVTSLRDLESLEIVGGRFNLDALPLITSLAGLESLRGVGTRLYIANNTSLENIDALAGLREMAYRGQIVIGNCPVLTSLGGLGHLHDMSLNASGFGSITISHCQRLPDLTGLESLSELNSLHISACEGLTSLRGTENLNCCGSLRIAGSPALATLAPFSPDSIMSLSMINTGICDLGSLPAFGHNATLQLTDNAGLVSLAGIECTSTLATLTLATLESLTNLAGLSSCIITRDFNLSACDLIADLTGLEGITDLSGGLGIVDNAGLTSLAGLSNLATLDDLRIVDNPALCDTAVANFIDGIAISGNVTVSGNAACGPPVE